MKVYLADTGWYKRWEEINLWQFNRLVSFAYVVDDEAKNLHKYNNVMLDSGAFTYLNGAKGDIDWDIYINRYANFINKYDVKYFIELDIDPIVGIKEVERLRAKLEKLTGKQSIPVWHKSRGKDYWLKMVKEYDYVAIGGIVTREIKPSEYKHFHYMLAEAKKENCKVHGLGFTNLKGLKEYPFYSVDSSSWTSGTRFGHVYLFTGQTMIKQGKKPGQRVVSNKTAMHNFKEWIKFANYMEDYNHKVLY